MLFCKKGCDFRIWQSDGKYKASFEASRGMCAKDFVLAHADFEKAADLELEKIMDMVKDERNEGWKGG